MLCVRGTSDRREGKGREGTRINGLVSDGSDRGIDGHWGGRESWV